MPVLLCSYSKTRMKLILVFFKNGTNLVYHFYSMNSAGGVGSLFLLGTQRGPCCHANEPWQVGSSNDLPSSSWHHSKIHPVEGGDMEEFFIPNRLVTTQKGMREGFFFCNFLSGCFFLYIYIYSCYIYIYVYVCVLFLMSVSSCWCKLRFMSLAQCVVCADSGELAADNKQDSIAAFLAAGTTEVSLYGSQVAVLSVQWHEALKPDFRSHISLKTKNWKVFSWFQYLSGVG